MTEPHQKRGHTYPKGTITTPDNPGNSKLMLWIRDHVGYQGDDCLIWPFSRGRSGYGSYAREVNKCYYVHRYMCERVHGAPPTPKHHAAHSCGRGQDGCVNPRHLSWKTNAENQLERRQHGTSRGSKLTPERVAEIRALKGIELPRITARRLGLSETTVRQIHSGKIWKTGQWAYRRLTADEVANIRSLFGARSYREIAKQFGVSKGTVGRIAVGRNYRRVDTPSSAKSPDE